MATVVKPSGGLVARRKERTRRELAEAATRLFVERGYEATTVEEIAAAVDVSARTFFRYFPTKGDIVGSLARITLDDLAGALRDRPTGEPLADALVAAVGTVMAGADPGEIRAFERLLADNPGLRAAWSQACHHDQAALAAALAARLGTGPADLHARLAASAVTSAVDTALETWAAGPAGRPPLAAVRQAVDLLTAPLLPPAPGRGGRRRPVPPGTGGVRAGDPG